MGDIGYEMIERGVEVTTDRGIVDKADIIHTHTCGNQLNDGVYLAKDYDIPLIETIHSPQGSITGANFVTTVAKFYAHTFEHIPNCVEVEKFKASEGQAIGRVGRMVLEKRYEDFIRVYDLLSPTMPSVEFLLAGTAPDTFEHQIYVGKTRNLVDFYSKLKIFLYPTMDETCPLTILQAMASEVAVVTYDIPATREMLEDTGVLVPYGDIDELAKQTKLLYYDEERRKDLVKKAYERVQTYSCNKVIPMYDNLYEKLARWNDC